MVMVEDSYDVLYYQRVPERERVRLPLNKYQAQVNQHPGENIMFHLLIIRIPPHKTVQHPTALLTLNSHKTHFLILTQQADAFRPRRAG